MDITALNVQYDGVQEHRGVAGAPELTVTGSSPVTAEPRVLASGRDSPDGVRSTTGIVAIRELVRTNTSACGVRVVAVRYR